jgi:hypothetical protein
MRVALAEGWTLWPIALLRGAGLPFSVFERAFASDADPVALARMPLLREAIAWQNRRMLVTGLGHLKPGVPLDKDVRRTLRVFARYIQRYAAKNDTIGFFGPLGWAKLAPEGPGHFMPAKTLIAARRVSFEPWAVKAILNACPEACARVPLRLGAHFRLEGHHLIGPECVLPVRPDEACLIQQADGRPRNAVLEMSGAAPDLCDRLLANSILQAAVPVAVAHDPAVNAPPSPLLAYFRSMLTALAESGGDADRVAAAMDNLESEFEQYTGRRATRHSGQTYAGRALVYEDCRRGGDLTLGGHSLAPVKGIISLMGIIARGYSFAIGNALCREMLTLFRTQETARVPLPRFWRLTDPLFETERPEAVAVAARRLEADWTAAFGCHTSISLDEARAALLPLWRASSPGWPGARHHSPDLMWQAASADHLLVGTGMPILAEFHPGVSTFTTLSVLGLAPDRAALEALWAEDFPTALVSPIPHEVFARSTQDARLAASHIHIDTGHGYVSAHPNAEVIRAADLDVVESDCRLWAVSLDGRHRLDLMAVFERRIKLRAAGGFPIGPAGPGPRLMVDGVVIRRASWEAAPPLLPRNRYRPPVRAALRSWLAALGAPERVFARLPSEVKPVLVDRSSDLSLDMFAAMLDGQPVRFSEMLPDRDGLWLTDAAGERYTSELRATICDPVPYDGSLVWGSAERRGHGDQEGEVLA